jgi:alkylhydroperoxidase/carboxymuconolactone decarboxylase family protein YurZ
MTQEKRPRHYAAEIATLKTLEQRRNALEKVPQNFQEIVKAHLKNAWFANQKK